MKISVKRFSKRYLIGGNIEDYKGTLRSLRISVESPYCWSLIKGSRGGLYLLPGDERKNKNFVSFVASSLPRSLGKKKQKLSFTRVKFVIFKKEVLALFPRELYNKVDRDLITSYAHIGQHSAASRSLMRCKKATKEEYKELLKELIGQGYDDLLVMNEK